MIRKFLKPEVQSILKQITGFNLDKIFKFKPVQKISPPKYLFLTDEDYNISLERSKLRAKYFLRMPPVMDVAEDKPEILEKDEGLQGYVDVSGHSNYNLVFTDVSSGSTDRTRIIFVREPDGTLRRANRKERARMNQIYFPLKERYLDTPKMFEQEQLQKLLDKNDRNFFILERTCLQFDPDDSDYIRVTHTVYEHILKTKNFDELRSTRHFGPMSFYYAINKKIDALLQDMIERNLINDGSKLVNLFYIVNDLDLSSLENLTDLEIIQKYITQNSEDRHELELAFQKYLENEKNSAK